MNSICSHQKIPFNSRGQSEAVSPCFGLSLGSTRNDLEVLVVFCVVRDDGVGGEGLSRVRAFGREG